jgi:dihydroorotate dehydrogenase (fumarate)
VLFNRFYEPDIDLATLRPTPSLDLSDPADIRLPLMWISLLAGRADCGLAASGGVETYEEVAKYLLAGADVVMTTASLLRHGPDHLRALRRGLEDWMSARGFESIEALRGRLNARRVVDPEAFVRAQYIRILTA